MDGLIPNSFIVLI